MSMTDMLFGDGADAGLAGAGSEAFAAAPSFFSTTDSSVLSLCVSCPAAIRFRTCAVLLLLLARLSYLLKMLWGKSDVLLPE